MWDLLGYDTEDRRHQLSLILHLSLFIQRLLPLLYAQLVHENLLAHILPLLGLLVRDEGHAGLQIRDLLRG